MTGPEAEMQAEAKIIALGPAAPGWWAVARDGYRVPVACWAQVESPWEFDVVGLVAHDGRLAPADSPDGPLGSCESYYRAGGGNCSCGEPEADKGDPGWCRRCRAEVRS